MHCPFCHAPDTKVIDSRLSQDSYHIRRRRKCEACSKRFSTQEGILISLPMVVKSDNRREEFSLPKIREGIQKASQKRPIATEKIEQILTNLERQLMESGEKEVTSHFIGKLVMEELKHLDPVAYVRFASVYKTFKDVEEFLNEIKDNQQFLKPQDEAPRD